MNVLEELDTRLGICVVLLVVTGGTAEKNPMVPKKHDFPQRTSVNEGQAKLRPESQFITNPSLRGFERRNL